MLRVPEVGFPNFPQWACVADLPGNKSFTNPVKGPALAPQGCYGVLESMGLWGQARRTVRVLAHAPAVAAMLWLSQRLLCPQPESLWLHGAPGQAQGPSKNRMGTSLALLLSPCGTASPTPILP